MDKIEETKAQSYTFIAGAATLVVGLTWKDTFKMAMNKYFPNGEDSITHNIMYAIVLTFLLVIFLTFLKGYLTNDEEKNEEVEPSNSS